MGVTEFESPAGLCGSEIQPQNLFKGDESSP